MRRSLNFVTLIMSCALLTGCVTSAQKPVVLGPLVFPPPPEQPRFTFERTVTSSADLVKEDKETRMRRLLTGEGADAGVGFSKPFDVVACQGTIYVSDSVARVVMAFNVPQAKYSQIGRVEPGRVAKPLGLAADGECNLYVVDATQSRIVIFDSAGNYLNAIGGKEHFDRLSHVAVDSAGTRIFAVDTGGVQSEEHKIKVFDVSSGERLYDIGTRGSEEGQLNLPRDIDMGPDGLLYIVDGGNFRVQVFEQDGTFVRQFGSVGRAFGQFARPKGIALDAEGNCYVSDTSHGNFQIFTPEGQLLLFVGSRSESAGRAKYMLPAGVDVDEDGRVYMVDQYFRKLDIFRPSALAETEGLIGPWAVTE